MHALMFQVIDATGGGACRLRPDGTIEVASPGFSALTGAKQPAGVELRHLIRELGELDALPDQLEGDSPVFRQVGADGVGRELAVARLPDDDGEGSWLVLVDRSGEARLRRSQTRLDRQIDDLKAELAARERAPRRPRIRSMAELARRLDEALMRARRYRHHVTIMAIRVELPEEVTAERAGEIGEAIVNAVRGVDDLGRVDPQHWILVLPHTDIAGGEVVGKRIQSRLADFEVPALGLGLAQVGPEEAGSAAVERADQACSQAIEDGGGLLLAVALV